MKFLKFLFALIIVFCFAGLSAGEVIVPPPPINIDISNSYFEVLGPNRFRIRNLTAPAYPGIYHVDFMWDPDNLRFVSY